MTREPQLAPVLKPPAEAVDDDADVVAEDPCVVSWSHGRESHLARILILPPSYTTTAR